MKKTALTAILTLMILAAIPVLGGCAGNEEATSLYLVATGSVIGTSQSELTTNLRWKNVAGATDYVIYRSNPVKSEKSAASGKLKMNRLDRLSKRTNEYKDQEIKYRKWYCYKIVVHKKTDGKKSTDSQELIAYTGLAQCQWEEDLDVTGYTSPDRIDLSFHTPISLRPQGYVVSRKTSGGSFRNVASLKGGYSKKWKDTAVGAGKTYTYRVRAYRKMGNKRLYGIYSKELKKNAVYREGRYKLTASWTGTGSGSKNATVNNDASNASESADGSQNINEYDSQIKDTNENGVKNNNANENGVKSNNANENGAKSNNTNEGDSKKENTNNGSINSKAAKSNGKGANNTAQFIVKIESDKGNGEIKITDKNWYAFGLSSQDDSPANSKLKFECAKTGTRESSGSKGTSSTKNNIKSKASSGKNYQSSLALPSGTRFRSMKSGLILKGGESGYIRITANQPSRKMTSTKNSVSKKGFSKKNGASSQTENDNINELNNGSTNSNNFNDFIEEQINDDTSMGSPEGIMISEDGLKLSGDNKTISFFEIKYNGFISELDLDLGKMNGRAYVMTEYYQK